jgi:hypothetical protein
MAGQRPTTGASERGTATDHRKGRPTDSGGATESGRRGHRGAGVASPSVFGIVVASTRRTDASRRLANAARQRALHGQCRGSRITDDHDIPGDRLHADLTAKRLQHNVSVRVHELVVFCQPRSPLLGFQMTRTWGTIARTGPVQGRMACCPTRQLPVGHWPTQGFQPQGWIRRHHSGVSEAAGEVRRSIDVVAADRPAAGVLVRPRCPGIPGGVRLTRL